MHLIKEKIDLAFSLGSACSCASILKDVQLRKFSSPFDWLHGNSFEGRCDLLLSNFDGFINKEDLVHVGSREHPEPCEIYANTKNNLVFNHDFPINTPLEQSYPCVKEKYDRRISRLLHKIQNASSCIIVFIELPTVEKSVMHETVIEKYKLIAKKFPSTQIKLLYFFNNKSSEKILHYENGNVIIAETNYTSLLAEEFFYVPNGKPLIKILSAYRIRGAFWGDTVAFTKNKAIFLKNKIYNVLKKLFTFLYK